MFLNNLFGVQYQQSVSGSFEQYRKKDPSINFFEKKSTVIKFVMNVK